jgi:hypothetical protein
VKHLCRVYIDWRAARTGAGIPVMDEKRTPLGRSHHRSAVRTMSQLSMMRGVVSLATIVLTMPSSAASFMAKFLTDLNVFPTLNLTRRFFLRYLDLSLIRMPLRPELVVGPKSCNSRNTPPLWVMRGERWGGLSTKGGEWEISSVPPAHTQLVCFYYLGGRDTASLSL